MKCIIILLVECVLVRISSGSIAGVTYMDDFDFEDRYKDVTECDPFYWHPLHLPEHCAEMLEQLIRSRLAYKLGTPLRVVKKKKRHGRTSHYRPDIPVYDDEFYYGSDSSEYVEQMTPYSQMLELLKRDIHNQPTAPKMGMMTNIGPVAVYQQPISKKSEVMIKTMAKAYAKAYKTSGIRNYGGFNGRIDILEPKEFAQEETHGGNNTPENNDPVVSSKQFRNGNLIKILKKNK